MFWFVACIHFFSENATQTKQNPYKIIQAIWKCPCTATDATPATTALLLLLLIIATVITHYSYCCYYY